MLVRFNSDAGIITMFGDVAVTLLKMMGQSGAVPGAIRPEDMSAGTVGFTQEKWSVSDIKGVRYSTWVSTQ